MSPASVQSLQRTLSTLASGRSHRRAGSVSTAWPVVHFENFILAFLVRHCLCDVTLSPKGEAAVVDWTAEFRPVRDGSKEIVAEIRKLAEAGEWEAVKEKTKDSDLSFRKL